MSCLVLLSLLQDALGRSCLKLKGLVPKPCLSPGRACVAPPEEVVVLGAKKWDGCAVVKRFAERLWSNLGLKEVTSNGQGIFILKFNSPGDMVKVIEDGLWFLGGKPFFVRKWTRNPDMVVGNIEKIAIWVKIYGVPLEFWNSKRLSCITSGLGCPFFMDSVMEEGSRIEYARLSIEMGVDCAFPDFIDLLLPNGDKLELGADYSWSPLRCSNCKRFGHSCLDCK